MLAMDGWMDVWWLTIGDPTEIDTTLQIFDIDYVVGDWCFNKYRYFWSRGSDAYSSFT